MTTLKATGVKNVNSRLLLSVLAAAGALASCTDQPETQCFAALTPYAPFTARYTKVSGDDCEDEPTAQFIGVETYVRNPTHPGDGINSVALQVQEAGEFLLRAKQADPPVTDAAHKPYALGKFTSKHPNGEDVCTIPTMSVAQVVLPEIPEQTTDDGDDEDMDPDVIPAQPAVDVKYEWSNVRVYVTAADVGTQFAADLKYTKNGCTATYKVLAVNAQVSCEGEGGTPDDASCEGAASANFGALSCDPNLLHCVLDGEFPSLN